MHKLTILICILISLGCIVPIFGYFYTSIFHTCFMQCPDNDSMCKYITYDINGNHKKKEMKKPCIFNGWNLAHILLFMLLAFIFPEYYLLLILAGIIWEVAEYFVGVDNWLDIVWNTIGVMAGVTIHHLFLKNNI
jgi:hypothetical protein